MRRGRATFTRRRRRCRVIDREPTHRFRVRRSSFEVEVEVGRTIAFVRLREADVTAPRSRKEETKRRRAVSLHPSVDLLSVNPSNVFFLSLI